MNYDITQLNEKLFNKEKDNAELSSKIQTMTNLLTQCDKTRDELLNRLKSETSKCHMYETEYTSMKDTLKKI